MLQKICERSTRGFSVVWLAEGNASRLRTHPADAKVGRVDVLEAKPNQASYHVTLAHKRCV